MKWKNNASMALVLMAALLTFTMSACKKTNFDEQATTKTKPRSAGDGLNDLLGYGYDVTGEYANSSASRFQVINVEQLKLDQPFRIEWDLSKRQVGNLVAGDDLKKFLQKKSIKIKGSVEGTTGVAKALFKASITSTFSSSDAFEQKYVYSSYDLVIQQKRVKMNAGLALLRAYLMPNFVHDLQNETPQYIVRTYGTHILTDITLGGKLQVMYRSETNNGNRELASEAGIDVSLAKVFNVVSGYNHTLQETQANFSQALHYQTIGGDPAKRLVNQIPISGSFPTVNIADWQASCTLDNSEMIDFVPETLVPLYDLVSDPVQQAALKAYIDQYLTDNQAQLQENSKIYAKISYENLDGWSNDDYSMNVYYYDYYVRFYKSDRVTPARVSNLNINYRINSECYTESAYNWKGQPRVFHAGHDVNHVVSMREIYQITERVFDDYTRTVYSPMELLPGQGYEILP